MPKPMTQQLVRELKAHPVKAGLLGALAAVALWFWAPLVLETLGTDGESEPSQELAAATKSAAITPVPDAPMQAPQQNSSKSWKQLVELMASDPLKQPLAEITVDRNPFEQPQVPAVETENALPLSPIANGQSRLANPEKPHVVGPALMGTAISRHRRSAVIDGKAIQEGDFIQAQDGKKYFVERISARKVTLRSGTETLELTQDRAELTEDAARNKVIIRRTSG
ncbi:MAG: hypothetical protein MPJ50_15285 [Pirellulales bacterium]|nr:hypothetical protein [Pirellulales bacterium]